MLILTAESDSISWLIFGYFFILKRQRFHVIDVIFWHFDRPKEDANKKQDKNEKRNNWIDFDVLDGS
jgi:hypothetical protein